MLSFHVKLLETDRRTDRWTDRRTMVKQHAPDLSMRGHKNYENTEGKKKIIITLGTSIFFPFPTTLSALEDEAFNKSFI